MRTVTEEHMWPRGAGSRGPGQSGGSGGAEACRQQQRQRTGQARVQSCRQVRPREQAGHGTEGGGGGGAGRGEEVRGA